MIFKKKTYQWIIIFFLISPFFILFSQLSKKINLDTSELLWAFKNSLIQSSIASGLSIVFGLFLALGLLALDNKEVKTKIFSYFFLIPNFLPTLFILIGLMNMIDPFPVGTVGLILAYVFINSGLAAILLKESIYSKLSTVTELAFVLGVNRKKYYLDIFFPLMKKNIFDIFLLIFSLCFTNFSIPLILGGGRGVNLEILIYEKIKISSDWESASWIALIQTGIIFLFSIAFYKSDELKKNISGSFKLLGKKIYLIPFILLYGYFFYAYFKGIQEGSVFFQDFETYKYDIFECVWGTVKISLGVGVLIILTLYVISYLWTRNFFALFLKSYFSPSSALIGFVFLMIGNHGDAQVYLKIILALTIVFLTLSYRMGMDSLLADVEKEKEKAKIFGATEIQIFKKIIAPLVTEKIFILAGFVAFWTSGEYAISSILSSKTVTVAMLTQAFLTHYQIGFASLLSVVVLLLGIVIFLIFVGVGYVLSRRIKNSI